MTNTQLSPQAAAVLDSARSASKCTPSTVGTLNLLLNPTQPSKPPTGKGILAQQLKSQNGSIRTTIGLQSRSRKRPDVKILDVQEPALAPLQPQERLLLATEIVNCTLKALNVPKKRLSRSSRSSITKGSSPRAEPLTPHDPNAHRSTPRQPWRQDEALVQRIKPSLPSRSSMTGSHYTQGLSHQAECARIAFATLRVTEEVHGNVANKAEYQIDSGTSVLIGRLINLGFEDQAVKELRVLMARLNTLAEISDGTRSEGPGLQRSFQKQRSSGERESIASMLELRCIPASEPLLGLMVNSQMQILKIMVAKPNRCSCEAALEYLQLSSDCSPARILERQITAEASNSSTKAARQMESLSQILLSFRPSASPKESDGKTDPMRGLSPQTALKFQLLGIQVRQHWWKLCSHRGNSILELVEPFRQSMVLFCQKSKTCVQQKYSIVYDAYQTIFESDDPPSNSFRPGNRSEESIWQGLYQLLANLARECGNTKEAEQWARRFEKVLVNNGASQIRMCVSICRNTALRLRSYDRTQHDESLELALREVLNSLNGNLHGEPKDLDELMINVASLRKGVYSFLRANHQLYPGSTTQLPSSTWEICYHVLLAGIRFVRRYIGSNKLCNESEKKRLRRQKREVLALEVARPFIDCIIALCRLPSIRDPVDWAVLDECLQECLGILATFEDIEQNSKAGSQNEVEENKIVAISGVYWYHFLRQKQASADSNVLRNTLRKAIDAIRSMPVEDKAVGQLSAKLEQYGRLHELSQDPKNACRAYDEAIRVQMEIGALRSAAVALRKTSITQVLCSSGDHALLGRLLLAFQKTALQSGVSEHFFDSDDLKPDERGMVLEQQLIGLCNTIHSEGPSEKTWKTFKPLATKILNIYTVAKYPIRRIRVGNRILQSMLRAPSDADGSLLDDLLGPDHHQDTLAFDEGLSIFQSHTSAFRSVCVEMFEHRKNSKSIQQALDRWSEIVLSCSNFDTLQSQVDDVPIWMLQLELLEQYLSMQGFDLLRASALKIMVTAHRLQEAQQYTTLVSNLASLGSQYTRLGYAHQAGIVLHKAAKFLETEQVSTEALMQYHIAAAECAIDMGHKIKCENHLNLVQMIFTDHCQSETAKKTKHHKNGALDGLLADAMHVRSIVAAREGAAFSAFLFARKSVKIYHRTWLILERRQKRAMGLSVKDTLHGDTISLSEAMSDLSLSETSISEAHKEKQAISATHPFWTLLSQLFRGLMHLSKLFAHQGNFPEAQYYLEQGKRFATKACATALESRSWALLGHYKISHGEIKAGASMLEEAESLAADAPQDQYFVTLQMFLAGLNTSEQRWELAGAALCTAEKTLGRLMKMKFLDGPVQKSSTDQELELQLDRLTLRENAVAPTESQIHKNSKTPRTKTRTPTSSASSQIDTGSINEMRFLTQMLSDLLRQRVVIAMSQDNLEEAEKMMHLQNRKAVTTEQFAMQISLKSQVVVRQAFQHITGDPTFSVLPDSTLSCPSVHTFNDEGKDASGRSPVKRSRVSPSKGKKTKALVKRNEAAKSAASIAFLELLDRVEEDLKKVYMAATRICSLTVVHTIGDILCKTLMMTSAIAQSQKNICANPMFALHMMELGKIVSAARDTQTMQAERHISGIQGSQYWDLGNNPDNEDQCFAADDFNFGKFQSMYIDIIPASWMVLSMSLSESKDAIRMAKICPQRVPLIITLPLNRQSARDPDEEAFGYEHAMDELKEIVGLANYSAHDVPDLSRKGAKSAWWEARAALDARLKDLISNVEAFWLGGFRGIFSQSNPPMDLLSRFQQTFNKILDKYLPSRQKSSKAISSPRITLDLHVLQLFITVGDPSELGELDEQLMDLLYFVVDILQFNGETNAYDEIDFDSIAVETIDALHHYHRVAEDRGDRETYKHTILILDKALHGFPWEALPCMNGHAVSRLPSLACLRQRILHQKFSSITHGICVERDSGFSILNPGGDLKATQAKFEWSLQSLKNWEVTTQVQPHEEDIANKLQDRDIYLYFGHGSGSQYIRSRTVKKLEKCAVSLLMGCSSGALTDAGIFEPYGTPVDYMQAGCPALVATLWDVTDKDIDRFSDTVLNKWGLFKEAPPEVSASPVTNRSPTKRRAKGKQATTAKNDEVSLDQAVTLSRGSCILRYLNGAAPVIYGVPVFLS